MSTLPKSVESVMALVDCPECWPTIEPVEVELGLWEVRVTHGPQCNLPAESHYA